LAEFAPSVFLCAPAFAHRRRRLGVAAGFRSLRRTSGIYCGTLIRAVRRARCSVSSAPRQSGLPERIDFGDSYTDIVLKGDTPGGVPVAVFLQTDKSTHGLKRIQLEPLGHQVNPPASRAIAAALDAEYGRPDQTCVTPPLSAGEYQASVEQKWVRGDATVSTIFRDTTLQAFEGCLFGPASGWCGLHGQLLVRIAPPGQSTKACTPVPQTG
jgi:hypothetical protein